MLKAVCGLFFCLDSLTVQDLTRVVVVGAVMLAAFLLGGAVAATMGVASWLGAFRVPRVPHVPVVPRRVFSVSSRADPATPLET